MRKFKLTTTQTAFEYAFFMIASSYFEKVRNISACTEESMHLWYREQSPEKQCRLERFCISYMEKLMQRLPKRIFTQKMQVQLIRRDNGLTEIVFRSRDVILSFYAIYAGRRSVIDLKVYSRAGKRRCPERKGAGA